MDYLAETSKRLAQLSANAKNAKTIGFAAYVKRAVGQTIEAEIPNGFIGEVCQLRGANNNIIGHAEIIGINGNRTILSSYGHISGLSEASTVQPLGEAVSFPVGEELLGRVVDAWGRPLDNKELFCQNRRAIFANPPAPLERNTVEETFATGISAIDGLNTIGRGQRICVIGPAGSGKSQMMAKIISQGDFDIAIVGLVGERGREVRDFVEKSIPESMRARTATIVATADCAALERVHAAHAATTLAEYFRDKGKNVLLIIDSITRFSRALREVGLAAGEPPTRRGFPSSVFAELPRLFERSGNNLKGAITAIYTLLVESDKDEDPIAEETRSLLDGHIILSGALAASGMFPAIDIAKSHSRLMSRFVSANHMKYANKLRELNQKYQDVELLLQIGEYQFGRDKIGDLAINKHEAIKDFCHSYLEKNSNQNLEQILQNITQ